MKVDRELMDELNRRNAIIAEERKRAYDDAMGVQAALFLNLPRYLTVFDLMRERGITIPPYNIAVCGGNGYQTFETIADMAASLQVNLGRPELQQILEGSFNGLTISFGETYEPQLRAYLNSFEGEDPRQHRPVAASTSVDSQSRRKQNLI